MDLFFAVSLANIHLHPQTQRMFEKLAARPLAAVGRVVRGGPGGRPWRFEGVKSAEAWRSPSRIVAPPALSPDGRHIAAITSEHGKRRLQLVSADGAESTPIARELDVEGSADWSPDGKWIVIGGNDAKGPGLFKVPIPSGAPVRLTPRSAATRSGRRMGR
jgi:dipeptidyl aminopeptidase/acylaminoacyl peptidase